MRNEHTHEQITLTKTEWTKRLNTDQIVISLYYFPALSHTIYTFIELCTLKNSFLYANTRIPNAKRNATSIRDGNTNRYIL